VSNKQLSLTRFFPPDIYPRVVKFSGIIGFQTNCHPLHNRKNDLKGHRRSAEMAMFKYFLLVICSNHTSALHSFRHITIFLPNVAANNLEHSITWLTVKIIEQKTIIVPEQQFLLRQDLFERHLHGEGATCAMNITCQSFCMAPCMISKLPESRGTLIYSVYTRVSLSLWSCTGKHNSHA